MLRRDLGVVLGAPATWIAASAAALLVGHGFVLAVDLYSAASRSVEAHTLLASEFDPLIGVVRPTLGGLTLALSLFGPLIGARSIAIEKDRRTFHTDLLRVGSAFRLVARKWLSALVAVALPWGASVLFVLLWRLIGGHLALGETVLVLASQLLFAALFTAVGTAAGAFGRSVPQATMAAVATVAATWAIDAADGFSALAWLGGAAAWSPTTYLGLLQHGTLSLGAAAWFVAMTAGALILAAVGCRYDLHGTRRLIATAGAVAVTLAAAAVAARLPGAWDLSQQQRRSLPPAVVHALRAIPQRVRITVNLDREDSRRQQIETDTIAKLRLARPDLEVRFPADDARAPMAEQPNADYGRLVIEVGPRSTSTTSNSRREIVTALLTLAGRPSPDWSQPDYLGYPLVVEGRKRTLVLAVSYGGVPLLFLLSGLAITTLSARRRTQ